MLVPIVATTQYHIHKHLILIRTAFKLSNIMLAFYIYENSLLCCYVIAIILTNILEILNLIYIIPRVNQHLQRKNNRTMYLDQ
jgi:hypothetical protein